jgi:hypothetical protein
MRNAEARRQFEGLPEAAPFQNTPFLPHVLDRSTAEQILVTEPLPIWHFLIIFYAV